MNKKANLRRLLVEGAGELGVALDEAAAGLFFQYLEELKVWNRKINLTSIEGDEEIVIRHFLDSLTLFRVLGGVKSLIDIGSGAGFPGIPLKIASPALSVTLLDSVEKKAHFMRSIIRKLGLNAAGGSIEAISGRVEDATLVRRYAGAFDCAISRAFTELSGFVALSSPYVRPGGLIIAMKGPSVGGELAGPFGGMEGPPEIIKVRVPFSDRTTSLVVFRKK